VASGTLIETLLQICECDIVLQAWIANADMHTLETSSSLTELISLPSNRASCSSRSGRVTPDISDHDDGEDQHDSSATFVRTDWDT
jgi:hypothetical protein